MSSQRNIAWLIEKQQKLARLKQSQNIGQESNPKIDVDTEKTQRLNTKTMKIRMLTEMDAQEATEVKDQNGQNLPQQLQSSNSATIAFSNPIYDSFPSFSASPSSQTSKIDKIPETSDDDNQNTSAILKSKPVPKPRKSKLKQISPLSSSSSPKSYSADSSSMNVYANVSARIPSPPTPAPISPISSSCSHSSEERCESSASSTSSSISSKYPETITPAAATHSNNSLIFFFEQEFPAKMAELLSEIEILAESLANSDSEKEEEEVEEEEVKKEENSSRLPANTQPGKARRKLVKVKPEMFRFSLSLDSEDSKSTATSSSTPPSSQLSSSSDVIIDTKSHDNDNSIASDSTIDIKEILPKNQKIPAQENLLSPSSLLVDRSSDSPPPPPKLPPRKPIRKLANSIVEPQRSPPPVPHRENIENLNLIKQIEVSSNQEQQQQQQQEHQPKSHETPETQINQNAAAAAAVESEKQQAEIDLTATKSSPSSPPLPLDCNDRNDAVKEPNENNQSLDQDQGQVNNSQQSQQQPQQQPKPPLPPLNCELLSMEHLHVSKLSLQRCGYLWKTGPNYKHFKYRWCILYRHNIDLADANFSYYFNRSSISASLSGKIMLADIEFVCACEAIPAKTKIPKLEKSITAGAGGAENAVNSVGAGDSTNGSACFFEIGVRSRAGRVYLFAARAAIDRQLWMHAFVQALSLHAFKNKELYHFGLIRAKFTVTAKWQNCFALLTVDRYLYIFELMQPNENETIAITATESMIRSVNCKNYHIFNLRKTVRVGRIDESGFSLTQNGGRVAYLIADFDSHITRWHRSITKLWQTPSDQAKMLFEEQHLTNDNIPVAIDKCLKFLDIFNLRTNMRLFGNVEAVLRPAATLTRTTKLLVDLRENAWNVHLLPQQNCATQISLLLLLYLRSMNQCLLTDLLLPKWIEIAETLEQAENGANDNRSAMKRSALEQIKMLLATLPTIYYATLRRVIVCMANANICYPLSVSLCKAMIFSKQCSTAATNSGNICGGTSSSGATIRTPVSAARALLTAMIKNHLWLFEVTKDEIDKEMHIKRVVHLLINQPKDQAIGHIASFSTSSSSSSSSSSSPVITSPAIITNNAGDFNQPNETRYGNTANIAPQISSQAIPQSSPLTLINARQVNSLIIGIKVSISCDPCNASNMEKSVVNVHLNHDTTADDLLDMVLEKTLMDQVKERFGLFEVLCYRRLERIVTPTDRVLPIVLAWSNWPAHWCAEAALEVRLADSLMKGSLAMLRNKDRYRRMNSCAKPPITPSISAPETFGEAKKPRSPSSRRILSSSQSVKGTRSIKLPQRYDSSNHHHHPHHHANQNILMSIIRYCGRSDTRLWAKILAEFSGSSLFLYCKENRRLLGQYAYDDFVWYVGIENDSMLIQSNQDDCGNKSKSATQQQQQQQQIVNKNQSTTISASTLSSSSKFDYPALTIVDRRQLYAEQSADRLNFGESLIFNSWSELYQWIRAFQDSDSKAKSGD